MQCEKARENFKALEDRELGRMQLLRIVWHLRHCAECAEEFVSLRRLNALLLASDLIVQDVPDFSIMPVAASTLTPPRRWTTGRKLIGGVVVTAVCILLLLTLPHSKKATSASAAIRQALAQVNTWHLQGWKMMDGKRVPWAAWRQQRPYFYFETIGNDVTLDDGKQRLRLIHADRGLGRSQDILLRTVSQPYLGIVNAEASEGEEIMQRFDPDWWRENRKPSSETGDQLIFRDGSCTDIVDKRTFLPVQLEFAPVDDISPAHQRAQFLRAEYNVPLPPTITRFQWPQDARLIDCVDGFTPLNISRENTMSKSGLTIQVTPLQMDAQGNILLSARGWLGNAPLDAHQSVLGISMDLSVDSSLGWNAIDPPATYDDRGRAYISTGVDGSPRRDDTQFLRLIPVEPLPEGAPLPHTLTLALSVGPGIFVKEPGENMIYGRHLYFENMTLTLPLPQQIGPIDPAPYLIPGSEEERYQTAEGRILTEKTPVAAEEAQTRAHYYIDGYDVRSKSTLHRMKMLRAIYWQEKAFSLVDPQTNEAQRVKLRLADFYYTARNLSHAEQLCREVIAAGEHNPNLKGNCGEAETYLRAWTHSQAHP